MLSMRLFQKALIRLSRSFMKSLFQKSLSFRFIQSNFSVIVCVTLSWAYAMVIVDERRKTVNNVKKRVDFNVPPSCHSMYAENFHSKATTMMQAATTNMPTIGPYQPKLKM